MPIARASQSVRAPKSTPSAYSWTRAHCGTRAQSASEHVRGSGRPPVESNRAPRRTPCSGSGALPLHGRYAPTSGLNWMVVTCPL